MRLNWLDLPGWRWVFILEGLPAIIFGIITLYYMTDHPKQATWLAPEEREWVTSQLEEEKKQKKEGGHFTLWRGLFQRNVFLMAMTTFFGNIGIFAFVLWLPTTIKNESGLSVFSSTVLSALPFACAMISVYLVARSSDRTGKRKIHTMVPFILAGVFFLVSAIPGLPFLLVLLFLCLTGAMAFSWGVTFWILPSLILNESAAAATGMINIFSALGSFVGPSVVGYLLAQGYPYETTVSFLAACFFISATLVSGIRMQ